MLFHSFLPELLKDQYLDTLQISVEYSQHRIQLYLPEELYLADSDPELQEDLLLLLDSNLIIALIISRNRTPVHRSGILHSPQVLLQFCKMNM